MNSSAQALDKILSESKGRIVTVSFIKDNGYSREITGRVGVSFKGKPASHRQDSAKRRFFLLYSMRDRGFRRIDVDRVVSIKMDGLYIFNSSIINTEHPVAS